VRGDDVFHRGDPDVPGEDEPALGGAVLFRNFGRIEGVLASLRCRVEYLKPDWWQKQLRLGKSADHGDRWKAHLKGRAQALFPRVEVTLKTADALLILEAGRVQSL